MNGIPQSATAACLKLTTITPGTPSTIRVPGIVVVRKENREAPSPEETFCECTRCDFDHLPMPAATNREHNLKNRCSYLVCCMLPGTGGVESRCRAKMRTQERKVLDKRATARLL